MTGLDTYGLVPLVAGDVAARPEMVVEVRRAIGRFARAHGADERVLGDIGLGVTEAASNVVAHAYPEGEAGEIHFAADVEDGDLEIVISDDGEGLRRQESDGAGLGLGVIAGVSADCSIRPGPARGIEVWMRFVLDA